MTKPVPAAPRDDSFDIFHGTRVDDPFRPLEDLAAPATQAWVTAENAQFQNFIAPQANVTAELLAYLQKQQDYAKMGLPNHRGQFWTRYYHDGLAAQGLTQIAETPEGPWRTLLDPLALDPSGNTSVSTMDFSEDGERLAYTVSFGGDDATTLYVMNVATGELLPDVITGCRFTHTTWDRNNGGFHYSYPSAAGKRVVVKYHHINDAADADRIVAEDPQPDSITHFHRMRRSRLELISTRIGTRHEHTYQWRMEGEPAFKPLITAPEIIEICDLVDGWIYAVTQRGAERGQLVRFRPESPEERETLIAAHPDDVLTDAWIWHDRLYAAYTVDTADAVRIFTLDGAPLDEIPLPPQSTISFSADNEDDAGCYASIGGWRTPGTQYWYDYAANTLTFFAKSDAPETMEDCLVERVFATSKDGTRVPMTIIRAPTTNLDGTAATKLYGYGGFHVPLGPSFSANVLAWVRQGGIYAQANLRGGGEFGRAWYDGGRLRVKQNTFDDFIACAEWLISERYTSTPRLVIEGGSNGGLLTLACMLQRPELFGAVISHVPVTDMLRFDLHTYGSAWKSDYGDPKADAADFKVTMGYSPLHTVRTGVEYPPHLVLTADRDTRVLPSHAYKFVAAMQAANPGAPCYLRVDTDAGHGAGVALNKTLELRAETFAFCVAAIGPLQQG